MTSFPQSRRSSVVEPGPHTSCVVGSIPTAATIFLSTVLVALMAAGCGTSNRGFSGFPTVSAPAAAPSAKPAVDAVDASVGPVEASNTELASKVSSLRREAAAWRTEAAAATARAKALADTGTATKEQLAKVWEDLQSAEARNLFLEKELEESDGLIARQSKEIVDLRKSVAAAQETAVLKDMECDQLRSSLATANVRIREAGIEAARQSDRANEAEKEAANAKVYKRWIIIGAVILALLWLAREILPKILKP